MLGFWKPLPHTLFVKPCGRYFPFFQILPDSDKSFKGKRSEAVGDLNFWPSCFLLTTYSFRFFFVYLQTVFLYKI